MALSNNPRVRLAELRERWDADRRSRVFLQLAEEYRRQGQPGDAIGVLEVGLSHNPSSVAGQVALGRCLVELARHEEARDVLESVLARDPTQMVAYRHLIDLHLSLGELDKAAERLSVYEQLNPLDPALPQLLERVAERRESPSADDAGETPAPAADVELAAEDAEPADAATSAPAPAAASEEPPRHGAATAAPIAEAPITAEAAAETAARGAVPPEDARHPLSAEQEQSSETEPDRPGGPPPRESEPSDAMDRAGSAREAAVEDVGSDDGVGADGGSGRAAVWGEVFALPTDLAASSLHFSPGALRRLSTSRRHESREPDRAAAPAGRSHESEPSAPEPEPEEAAAPREAPAAPSPAAAAVVAEPQGALDGRRDADPGAAARQTAARLEGEEASGSEPGGRVPPRAAKSPGGSPERRLDAARILALYDHPRRPGLQMTPGLERRRQLIGNYLRALRELREEPS